MSREAHTAGLHRGYADNLRVEWDRRGTGGFSSVTLLNRKKRPVAVLLGDYVPGEIDADMIAAANLFCTAPALLQAAMKAESIIDDFLGHLSPDEQAACAEDPEAAAALKALRAAIHSATGEG